MNSKESKILKDIYKKLLDREPDEQGIQTYLPRLIQNTRLGISTIEQDIIQSEEYKRKNKLYNLTDQNNTDILYRYKQNYPLDATLEPPQSYKDKTKIVIYSPPPDTTDGGKMVLNNLSYVISSLNYENIDCYIYYWDHVKHNNNFCTNFFNPFWIDDNTIVIYHELIKGNPLKTKHVIRWILLEIGIGTFFDTVESWDKNDLVYSWEPPKLSCGKQLVCIWDNPDLKAVNNNNNTREFSCYAFKKMIFAANGLHPLSVFTIHDNDSICIDNKTTKEVLEIFDKCHTFYCYDPNSFLAIMAPLRGCLTILHPIIGVEKKQYYKERMIYKDNFYLDSGISYGIKPEEIKRAKESLPNIKKDYEHLITLYKDDIQNMISDIQKHMNGEINLKNTVENIYLKREKQ